MSHILIALAAAFAAGLFLTKFTGKIGLPDVTGFLLAGLLIGPSVLGLISENQLGSFEIIISVALGFIAYSIGAEFKLDHIQKIGSKALIITFFQALTATVLVDICLVAFGFDPPLALTLGAIATATAPAATLMVVRQYHAKGPVTSTLLPVVAMDDAIGLMVFSVSIAVAQALAAHTGMSFFHMIGSPLFEIAVSLLLGIGIGCVISLLMQYFSSDDTRLILSAAAVLLGIGFSEIWGLSSLLICMSIGAVIANTQKEAEKVFSLCDRWTAPLFLLFFVLSGADLNLRLIPAVGFLGVVYIIARSLGKYLGTFVGASVVHADRNIRNYLGIALLPQAGVAIGMAQLAGTALPQYSSQIHTVVLCATLVYELAGPVLTKIALMKAGEIKILRSAA